MSKPETTSVEYSEEELEFRNLVAETFESWEKSKQADDLPHIDRQSQPARHNDGNAIQQLLSLEPFPDFLSRAAREGHALSEHPKALPHFVTHTRKWEKHELGADDPDFSELTERRQDLFDWYLGNDKFTQRDGDPEEAREKRIERLRPGGTGIILHGEQGTTKTTAMHFLIAHIMDLNPRENVIWQSTLDDTEWQVFGPWATMCLPEGVDVSVEVNPHSREYRDLGAFEIEPEDICRQVIRYSDPADLMETLAGRTAGQFYVVYPDPKFRDCQALTTWSYQHIWDADSSDEATSLDHFWFALMEAIQGTVEYNDWTTLVGDEAHKWLRQGASDDQHDWHKKVRDWGTYWGDARKNRLSVILAVHKWGEMHHFVRDKVRWGATMNGEEFPAESPVDGKNTYDQSLGDMVVWNNLNWNHVGYPNIKREYSVPGDIEVSYPGFEAEKRSKS